jgi:SRSO17 transposase
VERLSGALGHVDRVEPFEAYCWGLILPGERKSVQPMAARVQPMAVSAAHQSLHHSVAKAEWSDEGLLAAVPEQVLLALGPIAAWIVTGWSPRKLPA